MTTPTTSKQHYLLLDGLRGVAALMILLYHNFEAIAFAAGASEQKFYHGFLAVDFFLILSGFVMGYAYDDRWSVMSVKDYFKRRLIRLHPMVLVGVAIGLVVFVFQGCMKWDGSQAPLWSIIVSTLLALFLLPCPLCAEVRGNTEMFPLNGPHWSLFFEYLGSILYGLLIRKLSTKWLKVWVVVAAAALLVNGLLGPDGNIAYGWSSRPANMMGGAFRMLFAYPMGLLLARLFREKKPSSIGGPVFLLSAVVLIALLSVPSLGGFRVYYEVLCIAVAFPAIIWFAARGSVAEGSFSRSSVVWLGNISYPLYAIHYPFIYLYIGWINAGVFPFGPSLLFTSIGISTICILLAVIFFKYYDLPLRRRLAAKFLNNK